jgi:hypothetical protein
MAGVFSGAYRGPGPDLIISIGKLPVLATYCGKSSRMAPYGNTCRSNLWGESVLCEPWKKHIWREAMAPEWSVGCLEIVVMKKMAGHDYCDVMTVMMVHGDA